jgi:hypothetical protein
VFLGQQESRLRGAVEVVAEIDRGWVPFYHFRLLNVTKTNFSGHPLFNRNLNLNKGLGFNLASYSETYDKGKYRAATSASKQLPQIYDTTPSYQSFLHAVRLDKRKCSQVLLIEAKDCRGMRSVRTRL